MKFRYSFLALALLLPGLLAFGQKTTVPAKPNIIFILVDDLGWGDLGEFFQNQRKLKGDKSEPWMFTPQLDKMALEGAMLTNQYCAAPVCAPSRASILLGVSQGHANVRDNQFDKELEDNYTLGNVFQRLGYSTVAIGKWGLQGKSKDNNWPAHPQKRGFDSYYGYISHGAGHEHYPKEGLYRNAKEVWDGYKEVSADLDKCYTGDLFTAKAKQYIIDHSNGKDASKPFFMYLAYDTPHAVLELPTQAYPAGGGLNGGMKWLGKPGMMINTASGKPDSYTYPEYAEATYDHDKNPATPEVPWPDTYKRYASVNHRIDDQVGDILQLLKDMKIDQNTMVVFTSDNGPSKESYLPKNYVNYDPIFFNNFGPFDGIKRDVLEGGEREPTIAWWPGKIQPKTVVNTPNISYDWMATFADAAGMTAPVRTDGVSLMPSLTGKGKQAKSNVYVEYFQEDKTPDYEEFAPAHRGRKRNQMQMLRFGDTVGVRYDIKGASDDFEIYDVVNDPQQTKNLAEANPAMQKMLKERALQSRMADSGAPRPYDGVIIPAVNPGKIKNGLMMKTFTANSSWIPSEIGMKALSSSSVSAPVATAKNGTMSVFEGYIKVPADGEYTFSLITDNKAFLRIHDAAVIDEDYKYTPGKEKQSKMNLKAGYHPIKIYYMPKTGAKVPLLNLKWSTASLAKQTIPASAFFN